MDEAISRLLKAGYVAHQDGDLDIAAEKYRHVLKVEPHNADALHLLGLIALQKEDATTAIINIKNSLSTDSQNPQALDHLATAYLKLGQTTKAISTLERALSFAPDFTDCWFNLGNAKEADGDFTGAVIAFEEAIKLQPDFVAGLANLANALVESHEYEKALDVVQHALSLEPDLAPIWLSRGNALRGLGHTADAINAYLQTLNHGPASCAVHCLIADCYHDLEQNDKAFEHFNIAYSLDPTNAHVIVGQAYCQVLFNDLAAAETALDEALTKVPGDCRALAYKAVTLYLHNRHDEARILIDIERDIEILTLEVPQGQSAITAFNTELAEALKSDHTLTLDPMNKTTRNGFQSGDLSRLKQHIVKDFHNCLKKTIEIYYANQKLRPDHPQARSIPAQYHLESWSTILHRGGHQQNHIHPTAWMSGVYYVTVPESINAEDPDRQGWIEFGGSGYGLPQHDGPLRYVCPKEGELVLFPPYVFHRTIPFQSNSQRTSIAFDILPKTLG